MTWQPLNLTESCPADTTLNACSSFGHVLLSMLVQLYGGSVDKRRQDECNKVEGPTCGGSNEYDFIVVGAGAAGCVVANRLTENPKWRVLLLEAGPEEPDVTSVPGLSTALLGSNIDWQYETQPNGKSCLAYPGGKCAWARGKTMGGSSAINSLAYVRGNAIDYDNWERAGNPGWGYKDVLPFFRKSERNINDEVIDAEYHGASGEQFVSRYPYIDEPSSMLTEAYQQGGLPNNDYNGRTQIGSRQAQAISLHGERKSTNVAFIRSIRNKRPNLVVKTESEVVQILIDEYNNAYGVRYIKDGEEHTALANKEVIVSGGSINSPKLLMQSGIGPREHLMKVGIPVKKNLPVGKNLHDHVTFNGIMIALPEGFATAVDNEEILNSVQRHKEMEFKNGPLSGNGPVNTVAFLKTDPDLVAPDIQYQADHVPNWREYIKEPVLADKVPIIPTPYYNAITPRTMNLVPKSRGELLLNASNPNGPPLIYPNYLGEDCDLEPLLKGCKFLLSLEKTEAFKSRGAYFVKEKMPHCKDYDWGTDEYHICLARSYTSTTFHPVGTCKMGPRHDKTAVVDNQLRVYGIKWLRVIDAAIMPCVIRGNTNAPSIMIGERGVDFVIKYWRHRTKNYCF